MLPDAIYSNLAETTSGLTQLKNGELYVQGVEDETGHSAVTRERRSLFLGTGRAQIKVSVCDHASGGV